MNEELPNVQVGFRKGKGTRDQIANIHWITEKAKEFQENFCFTDCTKAFDCVDHNKLCKILSRDGNIRSPYLPPEKPVHKSGRNSQNWTLEQTGSKLGNECIKAVYCHPPYLTSMPSTSCEMPG